MKALPFILLLFSLFTVLPPVLPSFASPKGAWIVNGEGKVVFADPIAMTLSLVGDLNASLRTTQLTQPGTQKLFFNKPSLQAPALSSVKLSDVFSKSKFQLDLVDEYAEGEGKVSHSFSFSNNGEFIIACKQFGLTDKCLIALLDSQGKTKISSQFIAKGWFPFFALSDDGRTVLYVDDSDPHPGNLFSFGIAKNNSLLFQDLNLSVPDTGQWEISPDFGRLTLGANFLMSVDVNHGRVVWHRTLAEGQRVVSISENRNGSVVAALVGDGGGILAIDPLYVPGLGETIYLYKQEGQLINTIHDDSGRSLKALNLALSENGNWLAVNQATQISLYRETNGSFLKLDQFFPDSPDGNVPYVYQIDSVGVFDDGTLVAQGRFSNYKSYEEVPQELRTGPAGGGFRLRNFLYVADRLKKSSSIKTWNDSRWHTFPKLWKVFNLGFASSALSPFTIVTIPTTLTGIQ